MTATKPERERRQRWRPSWRRWGSRALRVLFPHGMDANEYALKVQPAAKSLGVLLNQAQWENRPLKKNRRAC